MPNNLSNVFEYFHECYRLDNRETPLFDFFDPKIEERYVFEGEEELLNNHLPLVPIPHAKANKILKKVVLFEKEKELVYGTFFCVGTYVNSRGETKRLCAPLFYFPATLVEEEEHYFVEIDPSTRKLNYPLLALLREEGLPDTFFETLADWVPIDYLKFEHIQGIIKLCTQYFSKVDTAELLIYPTLVSEKNIKSTIARNKEFEEDKYVMLPASILGLVPKSVATRGVLNELKISSEFDRNSMPVSCLFDPQNTPWKRKVFEPGNMPLILSEAQTALVKSAAINPITVVVGPPGTGKSYTIGAMAIDHISRGESVLIASKTNEAVDVVVDKLNQQLGVDKLVVRGGKKRVYTTPLNRYLKSLLTRVNKFQLLKKEFGLEQLGLPKRIDYDGLRRVVRRLEKQVISDSEEIIRLEGLFMKEVANEIQWGEDLQEQGQGFWSKLNTQFIRFKNYLQKPIWEYWGELYHLETKQKEQITKLVKLKSAVRILRVLEKDWADLNAFSQALKIKSDTERVKKFETVNFSKILKAFPVWSTTLSDAKDVLPFQQEMFDVLIIDEATQCDIASCLPLMQRAKRVVITGDPNQLRHVSFLSEAIQNTLKEKKGVVQMDSNLLDYRKFSILDLAINALQSGDQVATLDEHYRCMPDIIKFSNKKFYDNALKVMTLRPDIIHQSLIFELCDGKRNKLGVNEVEAQRVLTELRKQVDIEQEVSKQLSTTHGVISPFRKQVDHISKLLSEQFTVNEISKHEIRVGTAYSFQGEERDVMHISLCVDGASHQGSYVHLNKESVFNVSITRARHRQLVYHSVSAPEVKRGSLLHQYLSGEGDVPEKTEGSMVHDSFQEEVVAFLGSWGIHEYWKSFPVAGLEIDILLKYKGSYFGIDLVGYPGEYAEAFGVERYQVLIRSGITVFPLPFSDWYFDKESTSQVLKDFIENGEIF